MSQVYMIGANGQSQPMVRVHCRDEDRELQQLLERNYDLLPGEQIEPDDPRRWLLVKREMPVPDPSTGNDRWSIDFLFADQDAMPTFVECKRCDDTRSRREIVGQMLEYAANGHHYWTAERLKSCAEQTASANNRRLEADLESLRPTDDRDVDEFFARVQQNLREGELRVILFLDESSFELRSVVDFLNKQMSNSEVLLVEARQYQMGEHRVVAPRLFGYTDQARLVKRKVESTSAGRRRWDRESFFADASARLAPQDLVAITRLHDAAVGTGWELGWGTGTKRGSFNIKNSSLCQRSLISVYSDGDVSLNFQWLNETERERAVRDRFIELALQRLGLPAGDYRERYVVEPIATWDARTDGIATILHDLLQEFRSA